MTRSNELVRNSPAFDYLARPMFGPNSLLDSLLRAGSLPASPMDVSKKEDGSTVLEYNLAGFEKDDISVKVDTAKNVLYVDASVSDGDRKRQFSTSLTLNSYTKPEDISTEYKNGILYVEVAPSDKRVEEAMKQIEIK